MKTMKFLGASAFLALVLAGCGKSSNGDAAAGDSTAVVSDATAAIADGKYCFMKAEGRDTTLISISIAGENVSGEMSWLPFEQHGAVGTLSGLKMPNGELNVVYSFEIEGSQQTETKIMKIENDQILLKVGELHDPNNDGNLTYKDSNKAVFSQSLAKSDCK